MDPSTSIGSQSCVARLFVFEIAYIAKERKGSREGIPGIESLRNFLVWNLWKRKGKIGKFYALLFGLREK